MKLKDFQNQFQRAILEGDDAILADIPDGPRETKDNLLGIYRDAYFLRLIDVIGNDHERLRAYLGEERFRGMARDYIASCPSHHPNARWFSHRLPEFLKSNAPYSHEPILGDLAELEGALNDAFDGPDAKVLTMAEVAAVPTQDWGRLVFKCHPTATSFEVCTNVAAIWSALKSGKEPPQPRRCEGPTRILVWRNDRTSLFRPLDAEESMMWAEIATGASFGAVCQLLAAYDDPAGAPARAAGLLKGWLDAGLLSEAVLPE